MPSGGTITPEFSTFNVVNDSLQIQHQRSPVFNIRPCYDSLNLEIKEAGMYEINLQEFSNFEVGDQVMLTDGIY